MKKIIILLCTFTHALFCAQDWEPTDVDKMSQHPLGAIALQKERARNAAQLVRNQIPDLSANAAFQLVLSTEKWKSNNPEETADNAVTLYGTLQRCNPTLLAVLKGTADFVSGPDPLTNPVSRTEFDAPCPFVTHPFCTLTCSTEWLTRKEQHSKNVYPHTQKVIQTMAQSFESGEIPDHFLRIVDSFVVTEHRGLIWSTAADEPATAWVRDETGKHRKRKNTLAVDQR